MKINDTISVNPSKNTLGHVETPASSIFRTRILEAEPQSSSVDFLSIAFPTVKGGLGEFTKYAVPMRTLFATILIVTGITMLTQALHLTAFGVCTLCFGGLLALGLLTRPMMLGAAVYYCVTGALAIRHGSPDISLFSLMFGCLIFGVIGSGKYSCDTLLRSAILRCRRKSARQRHADRLGYKAFHASMHL